MNGTSCDFDQVIDRCGTDSEKWSRYPREALPLWVADMDFRSPEPVLQALHQRIDHGILGYGREPSKLREVIVARLQRLYHWQVEPEALLFLPGVVIGFNLTCQALTSPGDGVLVQTPGYPPILRAPANAQCTRDEMELTCGTDGRYTVDFERFEGTITPRTRVFILCNPHNPVGRAFSRAELEQMAEICLRHNIIICSDEIHCDFMFSGYRHLPIASLAPEIAKQTVTLMASSKTFNIPGLRFAVAIVPDKELRDKLCAAKRDLVGEPDILSYLAALVAYRDCQSWLDALLRYLEANRDFTFQYVHQRLHGIRMAKPEATYLAWLDCRQSGIPGNPQQFFLEKARVALNDGPEYGRGGEGFVRLNFGCPRATLAEALRRMEEALAGLDAEHGKRKE